MVDGEALLSPSAGDSGDGIPAKVRWGSKDQEAKLTATGIHVGNHLLLAEDIAGLEDIGDNSLVVHSYSRRSQGCLGGRERAPSHHALEFVGDDAVADKKRWLGEWKHFWSRTLLKKVLVFINPAGGRRKAPLIWADCVSKMFRQAGIETEAIETTHQGHAQEMAMTADLSSIDCIVCVSGDGLLVEVVNGLLQRQDSAIARCIPLGIIPGGTGNGLAMSLLTRGGEKCDVISATLAIIRGRIERLDAASVEQHGEVRFYSFLSLGWGLASDTDIEADALRWCGSIRFTIQGVVNIAKYRAYEGTLRILPPQSEMSNESTGTPAQKQLSSTTEEGGGWKTISGKFLMVWAINVTHCTSDNFTAPRAQLCDGCFDVLIVRDGVARSTILGMFLEMEQGTHINNPSLEYYKAREIIWEPRSTVGMLSIDGELVACGKDTEGLLPATHKGKTLPMEYDTTHLKVHQGLLRAFVG